jgi:hypothetical protein
MLENINDLLSLAVLAFVPLLLVWWIIKAVFSRFFGELTDDEDQIDYYKEW